MKNLLIGLFLLTYSFAALSSEGKKINQLKKDIAWYKKEIPALTKEVNNNIGVFFETYNYVNKKLCIAKRTLNPKFIASRIAYKNIERKLEYCILDKNSLEYELSQESNQPITAFHLIAIQLGWDQYEDENYIKKKIEHKEKQAQEYRKALNEGRDYIRNIDNQINSLMNSFGTNIINIMDAAKNWYDSTCNNCSDIPGIKSRTSKLVCEIGSNKNCSMLRLCETSTRVKNYQTKSIDFLGKYKECNRLYNKLSKGTFKLTQKSLNDLKWLKEKGKLGDYLQYLVGLAPFALIVGTSAAPDILSLFAIKFEDWDALGVRILKTMPELTRNMMIKHTMDIYGWHILNNSPKADRKFWKSFLCAYQKKGINTLLGVYIGVGKTDELKLDVYITVSIFIKATKLSGKMNLSIENKNNCFEIKKITPKNGELYFIHGSHDKSCSFEGDIAKDFSKITDFEIYHKNKRLWRCAELKKK